MKVFALIICLFSISLYQLSAQELNSKEYYETQYEKYSKKQEEGIVSLCLGGVLLAGGIALVESAEWHKSGSTSYTSEDPKAVGGILLLMGSMPLTIVGVIKTSIGSRNKKEFQKKLNQLSVYPIKTTRYTGLGLTYNF